LLNDTDRDYIRSDCYYLLGLIGREQGDCYIAIGYLRQAIQFLKLAGGDLSRSYLLNLELAKTHLESEDLDKAGSYIQQAEKLNAHAPSLFEYWQTRGRIFFIKGEYSSAKESFEVSLDHATNEDQVFFYHTWMGFTSWAAGDLDSATLHCDLADDMATTDWMQAHLNVVKIAVRSCYGMNFDLLEQGTREWLEKNPKPFLENALIMAKSCY